MKTYAVISQSSPRMVLNTILVDDEEWLAEYKKTVTSDFLDITTMKPQPSQGWEYLNNQFVSPPLLSVDVPSIPPDGVTAATATYTNKQSSAPSSVDFNVNDLIQTVSLTDGVAQLAITSKSAGDIVQISVGGLVVQVNVGDA